MSDETLKLLGLPEKVVTDIHLPTGVRLYAYTADQMRELQRQTVEVCAKLIEQRTLRPRQASAWTNSEPIKPCELAEALRSLLKEAP